jgi:ribosome-associated translation inhibitor RaiA
MKMRFKDVQRSETIFNYVNSELELIKDKFPKIKNHKIEIVCGKNTALRGKIQDGYFTQLSIEGSYYKKIFIKKYARSILESLDEVLSLISTQLNKTGDRQRVTSVNANRNYIWNDSGTENDMYGDIDKVS